MHASIPIWKDIERIAVFRALNLGDMLCSMPALRSLRKAFPNARISLIGLENIRPLIERFGPYVDELLIFPGLRSFPEQRAREEQLPEFYQRMRSRHFDLALQMHGDGTRSNAVLRRLGARHEAGFVPRGQSERPGRWMHWPDERHEIHRYLALLEYLGIPGDGDSLEFPLDSEERRMAGQLLALEGLQPSRTVVLHPGARLASRRWPLERFVQVGRGLASKGWQIAVTGSPSEAALAAALTSGVGAGCVNLCGRTQLGELGAVVSQCRLLICNDTGISHVAAAVGAASVVIASGSDVNRWAPLDRGRHPVLHAPAECRPCAFDECPVGHFCAWGVGAAEVLERAARQLKQAESPSVT